MNVLFFFCLLMSAWDSNTMVRAPEAILGYKMYSRRTELVTDGVKQKGRSLGLR